VWGPVGRGLGQHGPEGSQSRIAARANGGRFPSPPTPRMVVMKACTTAALAVVSGAMLGCNRKPAPPPAPPVANVVTITASDFSFAAPDSTPAGLARVKLSTTGKEPHQVVVLRIDSGKPMPDMANVVQDPNATR